MPALALGRGLTATDEEIMMTTSDQLTEQLAAMIGDVPATAEVVELAAVDPGEAVRRTAAALSVFAEVAGLDIRDPKQNSDDMRTVLRLPDGGRAVTFHASGAFAIKSGVGPFAELFEADPTDRDLVEAIGGLSDKLRLRDLLPADDGLEFERLWRIKAAGSDPEGTAGRAVVCRAVGSYRQVVRGLPVYGRASATLELTGALRPAALSVSTRRFSRDGGGATLAKVDTRHPGEAAREIAERIGKATGGLEPQIAPQFFRFGYLSLSRRRPQSLLAPVFVAALSVEGGGDRERSAHLVAVAGSDEHFLRLPGAVPAAGQPRVA
jgi:hypothetical protein